jgi:hypothetical protein
MTYAQLLARYREKHGRLVEPRQGFDSLHSSLWLAYSMGRKRGFTDLGTYVDKPGDHGWLDGLRMARAFDIGRHNRFFNKGWNYLVARNLAKLYWEHHVPLQIDYVILGDKIISRNHPTWRYYGPDRSHFFHIHVSGSFGKDT